MERVVVKRYSLAFKQAIVSEYETGASASFLQRKYGIKGNTTIKKWVERFGRYGTRQHLMVIQKPEERDKLRQMETRIRDLEHALADAQLDRLMLTACLTVAEEQYGVDLKKTREQVLSKRHTGRRTKKR